MGLAENLTQEPASILIEESNASENLAQSDTEKMVQREVIVSQNVETNLAVEEGSEIIKEMGREDISEDVGAEEKRDPGLVNVNTMSGVGSLEVASQNGLTSLENTTTLSGMDSIKHGDGKLETPQKDGSNGSGSLNSGDIRSSGKSGKRKAKSDDLVRSSWSLRSRSQEKPKVPEPDNTVKEATVNGEKKRKGIKNRPHQQQKVNTVNEFSKNKSHLRYLLRRINYEQSLIDAYSTDGWKGQSMEKLKPEKELQRAKSHILHCKVKIRELFQRLDLSFDVGKLPESLFDSLGEIDSEDIFCAKCGSKNLALDNDIILCDGACERGFHQYCLEPPLLKEHIPPGDEGWLCPGCDCKVDCIDMLKDYLGTKISVTDSWEKIFPEAAAGASGMKLDGGSGSTSDDSEDGDYDPDKHDTASLNNNNYLELPSDDSEDDDFDPSAPVEDQDEPVNQDSSSSDFSSASEDVGALLEEADSGHGATDSKEENSTVGRTKGKPLNDELSYLMETSAEPVSGKRRVERLDYKKLHEETYGNSSSDSSDEDFDDTSSRDDTTEKVKGDKLSSDESDYSAPAAAAASLDNNNYLGLPSDDSEDDDFDPSAPVQDQDERVDQDNSGSDFSSDSEDLGGLLEEDDSGHGATDSKEENSTVGRTKGKSLNDELSYLMETSAEPVSGKRRVERLDYKKLHEETYGNSSSDSSDEDFDDTSSRDDTSGQDGTTSHKRRKTDHVKSRTPTAKNNKRRKTDNLKSSMNINDNKQKEIKQSPSPSLKKDADGGPSGSSAKAGSTNSKAKKSAPKRIGEANTQRLYASFNENQRPDKNVIENLAKELDLTVLQVRKWFENARWSFKHRPRMESISTKKLSEPQPTGKTEPISTEKLPKPQPTEKTEPISTTEKTEPISIKELPKPEPTGKKEPISTKKLPKPQPTGKTEPISTKKLPKSRPTGKFEQKKSGPMDKYLVAKVGEEKSGK